MEEQILVDLLDRVEECALERQERRARRETGASAQGFKGKCNYRKKDGHMGREFLFCHQPTSGRETR